MKKKITFVFVLIFGLVQSQNTDLFRLEFMHNPYRNADSDFSRIKTSFNYLIKLKNANYFTVGTEYLFFNFNYEDNLPFVTKNIDQFHVLDLNLSYISKWNKNWRLVILFAPRIASTWTGGLESDDIQYNGTIYLLKDRTKSDKPFRLILGFGINSSIGVPVPLPTVIYWRKFHPKWSYQLGVPKFNLKHDFTQKHSLQAFLQLDGFFVNIQDRFNVPGGERAEGISYRAVIGGLGYEFSFNKYLSYYFYGGYTLTQQTILRDNDRDKIFTLNDENNFYFRTGIKIGL